MSSATMIVDTPLSWDDQGVAHPPPTTDASNIFKTIAKLYPTFSNLQTLYWTLVQAYPEIIMHILNCNILPSERDHLPDHGIPDKYIHALVLFALGRECDRSILKIVPWVDIAACATTTQCIEIIKNVPKDCDRSDEDLARFFASVYTRADIQPHEKDTLLNVIEHLDFPEPLFHPTFGCHAAWIADIDEHGKGGAHIDGYVDNPRSLYASLIKDKPSDETEHHLPGRVIYFRNLLLPTTSVTRFSTAILKHYKTDMVLAVLSRYPNLYPTSALVCRAIKEELDASGMDKNLVETVCKEAVVRCDSLC